MSIEHCLQGESQNSHLSVCIVAALDLDKRFNKILQRVVSVTLVSGGVLDNVQAIVKLLLFWLLQQHAQHKSATLVM